MVGLELYYKMFDRAPYGAFVCDGDGFIMYVNEMACKITGYPLIEAAGLSLEAIFKESITDSEGHVNPRKIVDGIYSCNKKDNAECILSVKCREADTNVCTVYFEDYTEIKHLEEENLEYIRRLEIAEKAGKVGSWELDIDSEEVWASAKTLEYFGIAQNKKTIPFAELTKNVMDVNLFKEAISKVKESKNQDNMEIEVDLNSADEVKTLHASCIPIIFDSEVKKVIGAMSDVTNRVHYEKMLLDEKNKFQQYIDIAGFIVLVLDVTGRVELANKKCCEILGLPKKDILGKVWIDEFVPKDLRTDIETTIRLKMMDSNKDRIDHVNPIITAEDEVRYIRWTNSTIKNIDEEKTGILSAGEDITEKLMIEKALEQSEKSLREAELITKSGHFEKDLISEENIWSDGLFALLGYEPGEIKITPETEKNMMDIESYEKYDKAFHEAVRKDGSFSVEISMNNKDDESLIILIKGVVEKKRGNPVRLLGTCQDITSRKEHLDRIEHISYHDHLTKIYNRRFLEEEFVRLDVKRNYPLAVIMADVNGLKLANDSFGHAEGDNILKNAACLITEVCREDDIIARVGGDEFMILLPGTDTEDVEKIVARLRKSKYEETDTKLPLSLALGYAVKSDNSLNMTKLFKKAEEAMYKSKMAEKVKYRARAIKIITKVLFESNEWEKGHAKRVSEICEAIGKAMNLPKAEIKKLSYAGFYHDIGKVTIRDELLYKDNGLSEEDYENIRRHPETGYRILSSTNKTAELADYVLHHHEYWNGKGYPAGYENVEIPLFSRIIAVAESYDFLTNRPGVKRSYTKRRAFAEIRKGEGRQFDPEIVKIFAVEVFPLL